MRLRDTLFLLGKGYNKEEIAKMDAEEAEALKREAEAEAEAEAKKKEAEAKKKEAEASKVAEINKELEEAKKALEAQQKKNVNEVDIGKTNEDDNKNMDELLKTIASYM